MTFVPFDILTAAELNNMHANSVALAAGTGLDNSAVTSTKIDMASLVTALNSNIGALTSYTPTVTAGSGTFSNASATGKYFSFGKIVVVLATVTITSVGTGASVRFSLPVTGLNVTNTGGGYRENAIGGSTGTVSQASTTVATLHEYDNSQTLSNGMVFSCYFIYEAA